MEGSTERDREEIQGILKRLEEGQKEIGENLEKVKGVVGIIGIEMAKSELEAFLIRMLSVGLGMVGAILGGIAVIEKPSVGEKMALLWGLGLGSGLILAVVSALLGRWIRVRRERKRRRDVEGWEAR